MYSLYLILSPRLGITGVNWSLVIGGAIFALSIILSELKERI
jgi:hypothetical protein